MKIRSTTSRLSPAPRGQQPPCQLARHLEGWALGVSEASILTVIDRNPDMSQAECGRMLSIKRPNLNP
jgi:DNA-binding MarR family transcriptional regulator